MTTEAILKKREALKKAYTSINYPLTSTVDFWGQKMTLAAAISRMDKDDIRDGNKSIREWKRLLKDAGILGVPKEELKQLEGFDQVALGTLLLKDLEKYEANKGKLQYDFEWEYLKCCAHMARPVRKK